MELLVQPLVWRGAELVLTDAEIDRFWAKVDRSGDVDACWPWIAGLSTEMYGNVALRQRSGGAHRVAYQMFFGPIPPGCEIDHVCHNADPVCPGGRRCLHRRCVNPRHLEAVTRSVNMQRGKTSGRTGRCKWGHEFTPANTYVNRAGHRLCRKCAVRNARETKLRRRARGGPW